MITKRTKLLALGSALAFILAGCASDADVVSQNISKDSEQFRVTRRVVFFNGITDKYLLEIEGLCSIQADSEDDQLEVTCKVDKDTYKKHFLGLSDNVSYFVEQMEPIEEDPYHYKVIFKPEEIIPDIEMSTN